MRVYRGRADSIDADRAVSDRVVDRVADDREPAVRVWRPHRQVAFGRRDSGADGYDRARELAEDHGFPPVEREVGGRAVAYTGSTVAFARVTPVDDMRSGLQDRYDAATADLLDALDELGVDAREGEPPDSFCPGTHSVQADCGGRARKLAGLAQRVHADAAVVAGVLLVRDHEPIAGVLDPVYDALEVPFDPETVGSVARAGGAADSDAVVRAVETALVGGDPTQVRQVDSTE
ncbi:lipoate--protein ligase family protein [Halosimplex salinum]|uniref:lipoate--protein ligase family protein n=1 Tax=Halosimplex salinum TaxID=1710538 RepID=UPI000F496BB9|nr:lipoate--protein ligase family protein [Halosimplex salinum]